MKLGMPRSSKRLVHFTTALVYPLCRREKVRCPGKDQRRGPNRREEVKRQGKDQRRLGPKGASAENPKPFRHLKYINIDDMVATVNALTLKRQSGYFLDKARQDVSKLPLLRRQASHLNLLFFCIPEARQREEEVYTCGGLLSVTPECEPNGSLGLHATHQP